MSTYVRVYLERLLQDEQLDARLVGVTERVCMLSYFQVVFSLPLDAIIFYDINLI